jgi:hypothetical protein
MYEAHHAAEHAALRQRSQGSVGGKQAAFLACHDLHGQHGSRASFGGAIQQQALGPRNHRV